MPQYSTPGVYIEELPPPRAIEGVPTSTAAFLGETTRGPLHPTLVTSFAEYVRTFGDDARSSWHLAHGVRGFFENGGSRLVVARIVGSDGLAPRAVDFEGWPTASRSEPQGLAALSEETDELISLVYAPGVSFDIARRVVEHCEASRYRFAIIDGPASISPGFDPRTAVADSWHAALYAPWLQISDPAGGATPLRIPPGGHVAGVYARSDRERGVHKAPANEPLVGVLGLTARIDHLQQDALNPNGINVIREFNHRGRELRVWGARTLSSDAQKKYVNVSRLLMYLEHSIERGTQWTAFEANDEPVWARVRNLVEGFLLRVWRDGALQGPAQDKAYFVKCDRSTMTQDDIDQGRLICEVGVAVVKPAEYVILRVMQKTRC